MKKTSLTLSFLLLFAGGVWGAEIYGLGDARHEICKDKYSEPNIICAASEFYIEGNIERGDFKKFENVLKENLIDELEYLSSYKFVSPFNETSFFLMDFSFLERFRPIVKIKSKGGDVIESMKIGRLIRQLRMDVRYWNGKDSSNPMDATCFSACINILIASLNDPETGYCLGKPQLCGKTGIHRPSFDKYYFSELSSIEAESMYKKYENQVKDYMKEMGAPQDFINKTFSTPSSELYYPTYEYIDLSNSWWDERVEAECSNEKDTLNRLRKERGIEPKNPETNWEICRAMLQSRDSLEAAKDYFK